MNIDLDKKKTLKPHNFIDFMGFFLYICSIKLLTNKNGRLY